MTEVLPSRPHCQGRGEGEVVSEATVSGRTNAVRSTKPGREDTPRVERGRATLASLLLEGLSEEVTPEDLGRSWPWKHGAYGG